MGRIHYDDATKREAVALARVLTAEVASGQMGIGADTIRRWMDAAGPEGADPTTSAGVWGRAWELATARLERLMASGKLTAVQLATIAAIADRNLRTAAKDPGPPTEAETWSQDVLDRLSKHFQDERLVDLALSALVDRAAEPAIPPKVLGGPADVAWAWLADEAITYVLSLGDLDAWKAERDRTSRRAQDAALAAAETRRRQRQATQLDAETQALIEAAEAHLREAADASLA